MPEPPKLTLVPDTVYRLDRPPETVAERVRRRQFEARMLAREHVGELRRAMLDAEAVAAVVAQGGEVYPVGVREAAERLAAQLDSQGRTLEALLERTPEPKL
jgi:hypothetical protein